MFRTLLRRTSFALAALAFLGATPDVCRADRMEPLPQELEGVGVKENLNGQIPLDLTFRDENGERVQLRKYFHGRTPVIIIQGYYGCPMLCGLVANALFDSLKKIDLQAGRDYELIYGSIDAKESSQLALAKKRNYLEAFNRPGTEAGWHFLTGNEENIAAFTQATGFQFRWVDDRQEYAHAAVAFIATPDGRLSRYLYGLQFDPKTVRLSLVEAGEGKIGTTMDKILLFCFHYDSKAGQYTPAVMNLMRAGGLLTISMLGSFFASMWLLERRRRSMSSLNLAGTNA